MKTQLGSVSLLLCGATLGSLLPSHPAPTQSGLASVSLGVSAETKEILDHLSLVDLDDGQGGLARTVRLSGANLQIVNGLGATNGNPADPDADLEGDIVVDGTGNLIIGYNEPGNVQAGDARTGSHNLVLGVGSTYTSVGGLVAGRGNAVTASYASATAGRDNRAVARYSAVGGGAENLASASYASVLGGRQNSAEGAQSSVLGGDRNRATGTRAVVCGGRDNLASVYNSLVAGGDANRATGNESAVLGGKQNEASGSRATIAGGAENSATHFESAVAGGDSNSATGFRAVVAGGVRNVAGGDWSAVSGGRDNVAAGNNSAVAGGTWVDDVPPGSCAAGDLRVDTLRVQ